MNSIAAFRAIPKNRQNLAILSAVFAGFLLLTLVFTSVVIFKVSGNSKSFAAAGDTASLTFSWNRPGGYASLIDSGGKQAFCSGSGSSCSVGANTYWPGSSLIYNVKVKDRTGTVFYSSSTPGAPSVVAKSDGSATVTWPLIGDYAWVAYPTGSTCAADTGICDLGDVPGDTSSPITRTTANKLKYSTSYTIDVCTPNCGTGFKFYSTTKTTPAPPAVAACSVSPGSSFAQGGSMTIKASGFGPGPLPVRMVGAYGTPTTDLAILNADPFSVSITVNNSQPLGNYRVYVDAGGFGKVYCTADPISITASIAPASVPTCTFDLSSVGPGQQIKLWGAGGTNGQVKMQIFVTGNTGAVTDLGATLATTNNSSGTAVTVNIPQGTVPGLYVVRVAVSTIAVTCKSVANTDLTVLAPILGSSCSIKATGNTVVAGQSLVLTYSGFAQGASIRLFGIPGQINTGVVTSDSSLNPVTQNLIIPKTANAGSGYSIVIVTGSGILVPCSGGPLKVIVLTCSMADVNQDGTVNSSDYGKISSLTGVTYGMANYVAAYDLNKDGIISLADVMLAAQFNGQKCSTSTPPPPPVTCSIGSLPVVSGQSLVVSYGGFADGESIQINTPTPTNLGLTNVSTSSIGNTTVLIPATLSSGNYVVSIVTRYPFTTTQCGGNPLKIILLTCSMADVNTDGRVNSADYGKISSLTGVTYGMANYVAAYDLNKDGIISLADVMLAAQFNGQSCVPTPVATPIATPVVTPAPTPPTPAGPGRTASPQQIMDYINAHTLDTQGNPFIIPARSGNSVVAGYDFGEVLFGIAGCETGGSWNPGSINPNGHYGLFQYDPPTWKTNATDIYGYTADDVFDAYKAIDVTKNLLENVQPDGYEMNQGFGKWSCTPLWQNYVNSWHR